MQEMQVQSLGQEDAQEKEMATHSCILAWKIPWAEEFGRLQSIGSQRVWHNWSNWAWTHLLGKRIPCLLFFFILFWWYIMASLFLVCSTCTYLSQLSQLKSLSRVRLFATPWTIAYQAPPSMGFSRQECWSGLPFPSPGDLPNPAIEAGSPALQADGLPSEHQGSLSMGFTFLLLLFIFF